MVDKLELLTPQIKFRFRELARVHGIPSGGFESVVDLRNTEAKLPVRLSYKGRRNGIHKLVIVGVASVGLPRTRRILKIIVPYLEDVTICRIDLCVDLLGIPVSFFVQNCHILGVQNFRLYRSRGDISYYPQNSRSRTVLIYDRLSWLRRKRHPVARIFRPGDHLTRLEVQLRGGGVPFRRFLSIWRYAQVSLLENLVFSKLKVDDRKAPALQRLAREGLRRRIRKFGLQAVRKQFAPPEWAWIAKAHLVPMRSAPVPADLDSLMRKTTRDWLDGRIRFPRCRGNKERE